MQAGRHLHQAHTMELLTLPQFQQHHLVLPLLALTKVLLVLIQTEPLFRLSEQPLLLVH